MEESDALNEKEQRNLRESITRNTLRSDDYLPSPKSHHIIYLPCVPSLPNLVS